MSIVCKLFGPGPGTYIVSALYFAVILNLSGNPLHFSSTLTYL